MMISVLIGILLLPFALWSVLFFHSKLVNVQPKTTAESGVRLLYAIARWWSAVAWAADRAVVKYRTSTREPECEKVRRIRDLIHTSMGSVK